MASQFIGNRNIAGVIRNSVESCLQVGRTAGESGIRIEKCNCASSSIINRNQLSQRVRRGELHRLVSGNISTQATIRRGVLRKKRGPVNNFRIIDEGSRSPINSANLRDTYRIQNNNTRSRSDIRLQWLHFDRISSKRSGIICNRGECHGANDVIDRLNLTDSGGIGEIDSGHCCRNLRGIRHQCRRGFRCGATNRHC